MSLENNSYLNTNLLHIRPISAHLFSGILGFGTFVHQNVSNERLPGKVVCFAAKAVVYTGYLANSILALVESVAIFAIGLTAATFHALTKGKSEILQKYTIKCFAYSINSFLTLATQVFLAHNRVFPKYQFMTTLHAHAHLVISALASQAIWGGIFNHLAGRPKSPVALVNILSESLPTLTVDMVSAIARDFNLHLNGVHLNSMPNIQQHRQTVSNFTFTRLLNLEYRQQLINLSRDYLQFTGVVLPQAQGAVTVDSNIFILNSLGSDDKKYQAHLEKLTKEATIEAYQNKDLVACFAEEGEQGDPVELGQTALEGFYPEIYIPLTNYTQLKELELENNSCPAKFISRELLPYQDRKLKIDAARIMLQKLPKEHKDILVKKLLKGSSFDANKALENLSIEKTLKPEELKIQQGAIQKAYLDISALASPLHQGKLMSQLTMDLHNLNASSNNLFQGAIQKGIAEATKPK